MTAISYEVELDSVVCCVCGVCFAFPADVVRKRRRDHKDFWCPNGHSLSFLGESDEERLKKQLRKAEEEAFLLRARVA
jgi:hypothetical protein